MHEEVLLSGSMAKKETSGKRTNRKQKRREAQAQEKRLRRIRILGFVGLVVIAGAVLVFWRNAGRVPAEEAAALVAPNRIGPASAPVQIVEFGDFGCPACRAWHNAGIQEQLVANFGEQISFEFRHFPVITAQSPQAAEAAQCAAEQGAFWEYHDFIYEQTRQNALSRSDLENYAAAIGLDEAAFESCLDSGRFKELVQRDLRAAQSAGARGTPTFLINGEQAFPSYESMSATIQEILGS
jgi:protein-disulfide isomerase